MDTFKLARKPIRSPPAIGHSVRWLLSAMTASDAAFETLKSAQRMALFCSRILLLRP